MFDGKVALVTGGGSGIGRASARAFAEAGAAVAVCDIEREAAEDTVAAIADLGGTAAAFVADVTQPGEVQNLIGEIEKALGYKGLAEVIHRDNLVVLSGPGGC